MKLSTQEEYGLRLLLQLAREGETASLTIGELSRREGISSPNVAKILRVLRRGGLIKSLRGQAGGYTIARAPAVVSVGEALTVLGGRLYDAGFCDSHAGAGSSCAHLSDCSIRPVLRQVQNVLDEVLGRLTLASLLCSEREMTGLAVSRPRRIPLALAGS